MSCNTTEEIRIIMKYSTISGETPTIPESDDHNDGTWLPTDLYIGEFFVNTQDNLVWIRTESGITPIGATSGTASFIGDYVHISGGTYSGQIYAPTVSTTDLVSVSINTDEITADYFYGGTFSGDGSLLTGIIASWTGGTVSNPVYFTNEFVMSGDTYLDGDIKTNNSLFNFTSGLTVSGNITTDGVFYGDGSGLTNIPMGTYSDIYTISATISGNEIVFTRNDNSIYEVDLTPILATAGVADFYWDEGNNTLHLELNDGTSFDTEINTWDNISALSSISAPDFYGGNFYGVFTGTFSNDIYTEDAVLDGSTIVFDRTDGVTYSVDLSPLQFAGATGATGATGSFDATFIDGWLNSASYSTQITALEDNENWNGGEFTGSITGTYQGQRYYNDPYLYDAIDDNQWIRTEMGGSSLSQVLSNGELAGNHNIYFPNNWGVRNATGITSSIGLGFDSDAIFLHAGTGSVDDYSSRATIAATRQGGAVVQVENDVEFNMNLNGLGAGNFTIYGYSGFKGAEYSADYSANYTNRSLVDKAYVDAHAGGSTPSLADVLLVDNTTGDTDIIVGASHYIKNYDSTANIRFTDDIRITNTDGTVNPRVHVDTAKVQLTNDDGSNNSDISIFEANLNISSDDGSTNTGNIYLDPATIAISTGDENYEALTYSRIDLTPQTIWITNTSGQGVEYTADYSATFTNRSLVDKEYVDNAIFDGASHSYYSENTSIEVAKVQVNSTSDVSITSIWRGATGSEYHQTYVLDGNTGEYGKLSIDTTSTTLETFDANGTHSNVYVSGGTINAYSINGDTSLSSNVLIYTDGIDISSTDTDNTGNTIISPTNTNIQQTNNNTGSNATIYIAQDDRIRLRGDNGTYELEHKLDIVNGQILSGVLDVNTNSNSSITTGADATITINASYEPGGENNYSEISLDGSLPEISLRSILSGTKSSHSSILYVKENYIEANANEFRVSYLNGNVGDFVAIDTNGKLVATASGAAGTSGTSGINGTSGSSGVNGTSGTSGANGSSGTSGSSGANGSSGTSGVDGTSGTSGQTGTSGTSGITGTSGTSGTSGINGTSGTTPAGMTAGSFGITIDGGGSVITTGVKGYVQVPYAGTITGWTIVSDVVGSIVIDVWRDTYTNFPPTVADGIAGTDKPTLSSANKNRNLTIPNWLGYAVAAGDIFAFNVDSVSTVTRVYLAINITKS